MIFGRIEERSETPVPPGKQSSTTAARTPRPGFPNSTPE
jgi:hypothetical protein